MIIYFPFKDQFAIYNKNLNYFSFLFESWRKNARYTFLYRLLL